MVPRYLLMLLQTFYSVKSFDWDKVFKNYMDTSDNRAAFKAMVGEGMPSSSELVGTLVTPSKEKSIHTFYRFVRNYSGAYRGNAPMFDDLPNSTYNYGAKSIFDVGMEHQDLGVNPVNYLCTSSFFPNAYTYPGEKLIRQAKDKRMSVATVMLVYSASVHDFPITYQDLQYNLLNQNEIENKIEGNTLRDALISPAAGIIQIVWK